MVVATILSVQKRRCSLLSVEVCAKYHDSHSRSADLTQDSLQVDALWPLNRQAQSTVPNQLGKRAKATADAKGRSVVQSLGEAVMVEEDPRARVNIWVWIFGLFLCQQSPPW